MAEVMDVFVVTCLSSLELTIERRARDLDPGTRRSKFLRPTAAISFFTSGSAVFPNGPAIFPAWTFHRRGGRRSSSVPDRPPGVPDAIWRIYRI